MSEQSAAHALEYLKSLLAIELAGTLALRKYRAWGWDLVEVTFPSHHQVIAATGCEVVPYERKYYGKEE
jgi:hypothetical protein